MEAFLSHSMVQEGPEDVPEGDMPRVAQHQWKALGDAFGTTMKG